MARKKADDLKLPESFEQFAAQVETPAPAEERPMGGMVEKRWSGLPMWECPRCRSTTFEKADVATHVCKAVRYEGDKRDT